MRVVSTEQGKATVELTKDDLLALNNALNEVCNALDTWDFQTRMGCSLDDARRLLKAVSQAYEQAAAE